MTPKQCPRWVGRAKTNGELLALAESGFDVFLTVDRNLSIQQEATRFNVAVVVLVVKGNRYSDLRPLVPDLAVLVGVAPGQLVRVGA